ncbi:hypothetical protein [Paraburkholderia haematera]|uniref:hypothetical protein n=1 Tax=Paraburkholderia haematera TaxID=2793077 RepID=UPI001B8CA00A|nr:hypothetical protein [Paraburkholderia haematera]
MLTATRLYRVPVHRTELARRRTGCEDRVKAALSQTFFVLPMPLTVLISLSALQVIAQLFPSMAAASNG